MKRLTLKNVMLDFTEVFLGKIVLEKKMWRSEEIEHEFFRAMYVVTLDYLEENEQ